MNLYIAESDALGKQWAVKATDIPDATGKVLSFAKEWLSTLESVCPGEDLNVDLKFTLVTGSVVEL